MRGTVVLCAALLLAGLVSADARAGEEAPEKAGAEGLFGEHRQRQAEAAKAIGADSPDDERLVPRLIELLGSDHPPVRWEACGALGRISIAVKRPLADPKAVPALKKLLATDPNSRVRRGAVYALGRQGARAKEAVPLIEETLAYDPEVNVRCACVLALHELRGADAVPALLKALDEPHPYVRMEAARCLVEEKAHRGKVAAALARILDGPDPLGKNMALGLVEQLGDAALLPHVIGALAAGERGTQDCAFGLLSRWAAPKKEHVPQLVALLKNDDGRTRYLAMEALALMGADAAGAVAPLREALKDDFAGLTAIAALGKIGPAARAAVPDLVGVLKDTDLHALTLREMSMHVVPPRDRNWRRQVAAAEALARIGDASCLDALKAVLAAAPDRVVRAAAEKAIAALTAPPARPE